MAQPSFKATDETGRNRQQALLGLVRGACEMLLSAPPPVVESLTISRALDDDDSARLAARMAARLAEEYDLDVDSRTNERTVTVRLSRDGGHIHLKRDPFRNGARQTGAGGNP